MDILTIKSKIKEFIKLIYIYPNYHKALDILRNNESSKIILLGTPAHGNLGDQAIALSEIDFLRKVAEKRSVIEIPMPLYKTYRNKIRKFIRNSDTIIISGGGWMGNLWIHNEITIREIVSDYFGNKIIIFPQTLYYTDDEYGRRTLEDTKKIFLKHKNLMLAVRDHNSFECAQKQLGLINGKNLMFCPDMVIYGTLAQKTVYNPHEKIALVCLRKDLEKIQDNSSSLVALAKAGYDIHETTTVLNKLVPIKKRKKIVNDKMLEFKYASVVVTDRLHAMLFALLSGTPCIVFNNATGKVFGVAEYLKDNGMQLFMMDKFDSLWIDSCNLKKRRYVLTEELASYFFRLASIINDKEIDYYNENT